MSQVRKGVGGGIPGGRKSRAMAAGLCYGGGPTRATGRGVRAGGGGGVPPRCRRDPERVPLVEDVVEKSVETSLLPGTSVVGVEGPCWPADVLACCGPPPGYELLLTCGHQSGLRGSPGGCEKSHGARETELELHSYFRPHLLL